jgi:hypothetical protein
MGEDGKERCVYKFEQSINTACPRFGLEMLLNWVFKVCFIAYRCELMKLNN